MRPLQTTLAAGIALALASASTAAIRTTTTTAAVAPSGTVTTGNASTMTFVNQAPTFTAPAPASSTPTTTTAAPTTSQAVSPANSTTVDLRNQQTLAATAATHASGSTSAIDNLLAQGATTSSTTGNETTTNGTNGIATSPFISAYGFANPSDVTSLPYGAANTAPVVVASNGALASDVIANAQVTQLESARADASVNRAIAQVQRDRKRIGRNGQLLYSIAPRTNVDRSAQMPDDGPPPSLTGSNSTLAR